MLQLWWFWVHEFYSQEVSQFEHIFLLFLFFFLPIQASADVREAVVGSSAGEPVGPAEDLVGGLEVILGVTTAGEPGPKSIKLSSVASFSV